jgi:sugar diacid utilization regulator
MPGKPPATRDTARTRTRRAVAGTTKEAPPSADNGAVPGEQTTLQGSLRSLQQENRTLRLLVAIHDRLGSLVLEGEETESITRVLSQLVNRPVLLLDQMLRPTPLEDDDDGSAATPSRAESSWNPTPAYVGRVLQTIAGEQRALRLPPLPAWGVPHGCVLAPVVVGASTSGYVAILEPERAGEGDSGDDIDLLAAQHAARVYALALMRERIATEVSTALSEELLEGLLLGQISNEQAAWERSRQLGYDGARGYRALVLVPDDGGLDSRSELADRGWAAARRGRFLESLAHLVKERTPLAIMSTRQDELVVLMPDDGTPTPADLAHSILLYVASLYPDRLLTIGLGGVCKGPLEISRTYAQAHKAAEVAMRFGKRGQVLSFESLGLYRLLFQVGDRTELRAYVDQVLGNLIEYDRKHRTELIHTLATYLANNNSLQATARQLFVHVNTAAYRIQRIQVISGLDLSRTDDCLLVRAALMILEDSEANAGRAEHRA